MRIAYLDCFAGISGDMLLGALIDAGVDPDILRTAAAALNLGVTLKLERVDRSGITATKIHVFEGAKLAESGQHTHASEPAPQHTHTHLPDPQAQTQQNHKTNPSHSHDHEHKHQHGRSLSTIRSLIHSADLSIDVKQTAIQAFELLGTSEARIHNVDIEKIHFHEVGAVDAIVDIVAASAGIHALKIDRWFCSPLNIGGGMVDCAHGRFPVPAPATADLLRGLPTYSADIEMELVTPTGAALIRAISPTFGPQPAMRVAHIGYGAGTHDPKGFPNVLRLSIGESDDALKDDETVTIIETAIDDLSPQILAYVAEAALQQGALDVMCTAVQMKKGRLGTLITILTDSTRAPALEQLLLRETSTLGVRIHTERRSCLDRTHTTVATPYGDIRVKVGSRNGEIFNAAPEFEDCRAAAAKHNVTVKAVQQAAQSIYITASKPITQTPQS